MALTKVNRGGLNTGVADSSNATFLTATAAEGVTLAGTLAVTGVHTVGNNAVATSEGGAVTTIISQGLAKVWVNLEGDSTIAISDSFNVTDLTDRGTGLYTINIANNMGNVNFAITASGTHDGGSYAVTGLVSHDDAPAAGSYGIDTLNFNSGGQPTDIEMVSSTIHGDLA